MNIGIDVRPLSSWRAGIGNYVAGIVENLGSEHNYFLYSNRAIAYSAPTRRAAFHEKIDSLFSWCPGSFWLLGRASKLAVEDKLDVFWATSPVLPWRIASRILTIITVYDLVWIRFPETTQRYILWTYRLLANRAIRDANVVLAISQSTANDLITFLKVPPGKIVVVPPGVAPRYKPQDSEAAAAYIAQKYDTPSGYLAAVGTVEPRKNLSVLVDVVSILKKSGRLPYPLLIAGAKGWKNSELFNKVRRAHLSADDIRFLGYLPEEDLPSFYSGARLFLFPSLYEGFGLPPLEAMACGTPVIASNAPSMPEVLGDAAILEIPSDAKGFAAAVMRVLDDPALRDKMRADGISRASQFRWETSIGLLLKAVEEKKNGAQPAADSLRPTLVGRGNT